MLGSFQSIAGVSAVPGRWVEVMIERNQICLRQVNVHLLDHLLGASPADNLPRWGRRLQDDPKAIYPALVILQD
jgi:hypothetical protein